MNKTQGGYVALLAVLIVGAATGAIALTLLATGTDSQRSGLVTQQSVQARQLAQACGEEALQVLHDNTAYTGTGSLTLGAGSCSYTVASNGTTGKVINTTGIVGSETRRSVIYATINASSISVTSWQDVS